MTKVIYVESDSTSHEIDVEPGFSVMEGAVRNGIPGIDADCGGQCSCATCHVIVDPEWIEGVGPPSADEADLLEYVLGSGPGSRLSCQINIAPGLEGLIVHIPAEQGVG